MLLPCPFCGSENLEANGTGASEIYGSAHQSGFIECLDCGTYGPNVEFVDGVDKDGLGYEAVHIAWNNRYVKST